MIMHFRLAVLGVGGSGWMLLHLPEMVRKMI